jgi:hypothetical protein
MTDSPLYRIVVHVETFEDSGETRAEWAANKHRRINIRSAVDRETKDQFAREDLLAAFRWCAGTLGRLTLKLQHRIEAEYGWRHPGTHRCNPDREGTRCGCSFEEGVSNPRWAVDEWHVVPEVDLKVPTEHVEAWAAHFRIAVANMLADDRKPLDPLPSEPDHQRAVLTETATTQPRKAST